MNEGGVNIRYNCNYVQGEPTASDWTALPPIALVDTVDGSNPRLATQVKACWTDDTVWFRFECEDDHIVATMEQRDDPIYEEDVVEVFLDETGDGARYLELELSPRGVIFDAIIDNDGQGSISVDTAWDAEGLYTSCAEEASVRVYVIGVPFANFAAPPTRGTSWRWNAYRIDAEPDGQRHYWAWSPTGAVDYHVPRRFGWLDFV